MDYNIWFTVIMAVVVILIACVSAAVIIVDWSRAKMPRWQLAMYLGIHAIAIGFAAFVLWDLIMRSIELTLPAVLNASHGAML